MSIISDLADKILGHLTALGRMTASSMLPGLEEDQILQLTARLPFVFPRSVVELYSWSEGLRPRSGLANEFFPGYGMDSLPEMIDMYNELSNAPDYPRFRNNTMHWFPIFRSGGTDFYGVCCSDEDAQDANIVDDDNEAAPEIAYASLEAMLRTHLQCYETGVFYLNQQGQLDVGVPTYNDQGQLIDLDLSKFEQVARQFNPGVPRWK